VAIRRPTTGLNGERARGESQKPHGDESKKIHPSRITLWRGGEGLRAPEYASSVVLPCWAGSKDRATSSQYRRAERAIALCRASGQVRAAMASGRVHIASGGRGWCGREGLGPAGAVSGWTRARPSSILGASNSEKAANVFRDLLKPRTTSK
jgi:hypothetical protein